MPKSSKGEFALQAANAKLDLGREGVSVVKTLIGKAVHTSTLPYNARQPSEFEFTTLRGGLPEIIAKLLSELEFEASVGCHGL